MWKKCSQCRKGCTDDPTQDFYNLLQQCHFHAFNGLHGMFPELPAILNQSESFSHLMGNKWQGHCHGISYTLDIVSEIVSGMVS